MKAKLNELVALNNWMLGVDLDTKREDIRSKKAAMRAIHELPSSYNDKLVWASDTQVDWDASVARMLVETEPPVGAVVDTNDIKMFDPDPVEPPAVDEPKSAKPAEKKRSRKLFEWPANPDGVKAHRLGTKRAFVVEMLTGPGATFEEIATSKKCQWDARTCYEGIKLIHSTLGYGLTEDPETGIIRAFVHEA